MNRLIASIALALSLLFAIPATANPQEEQVTVPKSMLTKDQQAELAQKQIQEKVQNYGKWVGVGHELGVAINESLSAVTTQANNFAQTPVGKLTAFLVIWKVIGRELMGFVIGIAMVIVILPLWVWSYRRYLPRRIIDTETFDPTTKKLINRTYKTLNDPAAAHDESTGFCIAHYVMLAVFFICVACTMWGC